MRACVSGFPLATVPCIAVYTPTECSVIITWNKLTRWIGPELKASAPNCLYRNVDYEDPSSQLVRHTIVSTSGREFQVLATQRTLSLTAMTLMPSQPLRV